MRQGMRRMAAVALVLAVALSGIGVWPAARGESAGAFYGKVTKDQVYLRKQASTDADYWFRMDANHVGQILDVVQKSGASWYKIDTNHPTESGDQTYTGYVMADYFTPLTSAETAQWLQYHTLSPAAASDTAAPEPSDDHTIPTTASPTSYIGEITSGETNFRAGPSRSDRVLMKLAKGTIVELLSIPATTDGNSWYKARYQGMDGYINAPYVRVIDAGLLGGNATIYGYVKLIKNQANLRAVPGGPVLNEWRTMGEVLPYISDPRQDDDVYSGWWWYQVLYGGNPYWVRSDCVQRVTSSGTVLPDNPATNPPTTTTTAPGVLGYVVTIKSGVNMRMLPFGTHITQVPKGVTLPYTRKIEPYAPENNSSYAWYYVNYNGIQGYVRSDCVQESGNPTVTVPPSYTIPPTATNPPATTAYGYVKTIKNNVNLRRTPGGSRLAQVGINLVFTLTGPKVRQSSYDWYPVVTAEGVAGYLRGDCVTECDAAGNPTTGTTPTTPPTTVTTPPTVTDPPTVTPQPGNNGYIKTIKDNVNLRRTPDGTRVGRVGINLVFALTGPKVRQAGYDWYPVISLEGVAGYLRGDCVIECDAAGNPTTGTTPTTPPTTVTTPPVSNMPSTYLMTVLNDVYLRVSASKDAAAQFQVPQGTVMAYNTSAGVGSELWYRVVYQNTELWVLGSCVKVLTEAEYQAWQAEHPNQQPPTMVVAGYVKTTATGVNIRDAADGRATGQRIQDKGTILPFTQKTAVKNVNWYYIQRSDGFRGWITGTYATECTSDGQPVATAAPTSQPTTNPPGGEASYETLRVGSKGEAVTRLTTELKRQGYYTGEITDTYTTAVRDAVKAFQKAKGLTVDGVAGPDTQHALYGTVPPGTSGNEEFQFYPAEKIDWFTGGIQTLWSKGDSHKIYDVRTGIVWTAKRWSGANHVDAEPLTAADTARLCQIYGVTSASQITSSTHWQRRPCLVQIGEHNYACSLYGVPHSDYDTLPNNNFDGVLCIHFTNSRTSDSNRLDSGHQEAIEYAYTHSPAGHK